MKTLLRTLIMVVMLATSGLVLADQHGKKPVDYMPSLITSTPLEGRMLAIKIVRKTIGTIQTDKAAKHRVRKMYAENPMLLMQAAELVNMEFNIIAKANNYWRK